MSTALRWSGLSRSDLVERKITRKPGDAAKKLRDLDELVGRQPDLVYEKELRDLYLRTFRQLGRCEMCGRSLSREKSIEKGQGAVCARKRAEAERRRQETGK